VNPDSLRNFADSFAFPMQNFDVDSVLKGQLPMLFHVVPFGVVT